MLRAAVIVMLATLAGLLPATALAVGNADSDRGDAVIRLNGDFQLPAGESIGTVVVIRGDARIAGTVRNALIVIDGTAAVDGRVNGNITVIRGDLALGSQALVHNVILVRSSLVEASGSRITGDVTRRSRVLFPGATVLFGVILWVAMTVTVVLSGLLFAAVGGRQVVTAAGSLTSRPGQTILGGVVVVVGIPIAAVAAFITVLGFGAGLALLLFLLPALLFLGYLVAGTWLGGLITRGFGRSHATAHPCLEALIGLALLQFALLIPGLGAVAAGLLATWGAGGLAYLGWLAFRSTPGEAAPPSPSGTVQPLPGEPAAASG